MVEKNNYKLGEISVFPGGLEIIVSGKRVKLEPKVMALLNYFAARPNQVLTKEQILTDVWPGTNVVDEALQRAVSILRKKLGDNQETPIFLETISKKGYRFLVKAVPLEPGKEDNVNLTERNIKVSPLILVLTVVVGALGAYLIWQLFSDKPFVPKAEGPNETKSVEPAPLAPKPEDEEDGKG